MRRGDETTAAGGCGGINGGGFSGFSRERLARFRERPRRRPSRLSEGDVEVEVTVGLTISTLETEKTSSIEVVEGRSRVSVDLGVLVFRPLLILVSPIYDDGKGFVEGFFGVVGFGLVVYKMEMMNC